MCFDAILMIEDEGLRDLFRDILEEESYRVTHAASVLGTGEIAHLDADLLIL